MWDVKSYTLTHSTFKLNKDGPPLISSHLCHVLVWVNHWAYQMPQLALVEQAVNTHKKTTKFKQNKMVSKYLQFI